MRYRFYRVHKYVCYVLSEFDRLLAKTDFGETEQIEKLKIQFKALHELMLGHAHHEDKAIHALLREKGSTVHESIETEHQDHEKQLNALAHSLEEISSFENAELRISLGYQFYLSYRLFLIENLQHLYREETEIMPELHRLYTDDELKSVDKKTYSMMTPEQMINMLSVLSPHMDRSDIDSFLQNIKDFEPEKFQIVRNALEPLPNK